MENIKEELRQLIKDKILSTIMEGKNSKKSKKPVHPPSGASHQRPKNWSGKVKSGSERTKERQEAGKEIARQMSESREAVLKSLAKPSLASIAEKKKEETKPKQRTTGRSIPYNELSVSDLFRRFQEITKPK